MRSTTISNDSESRLITGCAVVFESWSRDLGGFNEIIHKGAITQELIDNSDIIMNINHDDDKMVARYCRGNGTLSLELTDDGLHFSFDAPTTALGEELLYNVRNGNLFECSFAFTIPDTNGAERWYKDADNTIKREINQIDGLYDCSVVTHAAYSATSCSARHLRGLEVETVNPEEMLHSYQRNIDEKYDNELKDLEKYIIN